VKCARAEAHSPARTNCHHGTLLPFSQQGMVLAGSTIQPLVVGLIASNDTCRMHEAVARLQDAAVQSHPNALDL
jgi:hypothetical protein